MRAVARRRQSVERVAKRIHYSPQQRLPHRHDRSGAGKQRPGSGGEAVALLEKNGADQLFPQMKHQRPAAVLQHDDVIQGRRGKAANPGHTIPHGDDASPLHDVGRWPVRGQPRFQICQRGKE